MSNPLILDPELPAYLLERKLQCLQRLLEDKKSGYGGRRDKILVVMKILEHIRVSRGDVRILESIRWLDDEIERFLLRRRKLCNGTYLWSCRSKPRLVCLLNKFEKGINSANPSAVSAAREALKRRGSSVANNMMPSWESAPRTSLARRQYDWEEETKLNNEQARTVVSKLLYTGLGRDLVLIIEGRIGAGKTTLMRALFERVDVIKDYTSRAWVSIHEKLNYKDVVLELIEQIGKESVAIDHTKDEDKLAEELFILLKESNKPYLIFLDDCTREIWPKLMLCFPENGNGSRLVISTAKPIPVEESQSFVSVIKIGNNNEVNHQQGLPPSYNDLHPLLKVCFLFLSIFPRGNDVPLGRVRYLWLSEGLLDDFETNQQRESLHQRSVPETLPTPPPTTPMPDQTLTPMQRDLSMRLLEILVERKLLEITKWKLDGSPKCCRMPVFMNDVAVPTLTNTGLFNVYNGSERPTSSEHQVRRLAGHAESKIPSGSVHRHLRAYMSFHKKTGGRLNQEISAHLKDLTQPRSYALLKMLDLEGVHKPELPKSIGNHLLCLRYLGLRSTKLDSLPTSTGKLQFLETVDLKGTNVMKLPTSLLRSEKLRHLHAEQVPLDDFITEPCQYHCVPCACLKSQQSDSNLETLTGLYIGSSSSMGEIWSRQFCNLRRLKVKFDEHKPEIVRRNIRWLTKLQTLKLYSTNDKHYYSLDFSSHEDLRKVYLFGKIKQQGLQNVILPWGLTELTLSKSGLDSDPMPILGLLEFLVVLRLLAGSYVGTKMVCTGFPQLQALKLWNLENLISLTVKENSMSQLEDMEIRNCSGMKEFVGSEFLVDKIKMLVLDDMPKAFVEHIGDQKIMQKTSHLSK